MRLTPRHARAGYLPQEADRRPGERVSDFLARRTGVAAAQSRLDLATTALAEGRPGSDDEYADALES